MLLQFVAAPIVCGSSLTAAPSLSAAAIHSIGHGGIHVQPDWIPPELVSVMRQDAKGLFSDGLFSPDGLTNTAVVKSQQGFSNRDRQTFRGDGWLSEVGDTASRRDFADRMYSLRQDLAAGLGRPSLAVEGVRKHEMTYNWYEPGAKLGRHLDEHHEETKVTKGWMQPTRRSVTWLVYLNDGWKAEEGGTLRTFPRPTLASELVGADAGNLQIGWLDGSRPVFMDSHRKGGRSCLYCRGGKGQREVVSASDFDVPRQPVDFREFLRTRHAGAFEQISTSRLDPRFATGAPATFAEFDELHHVDVVPKAGTLVLFDSVSLPHLVREVTSKRQRIAATGWFHEDGQTPFG